MIPRVSGDYVPMTEWDDAFQRPLRVIYDLRFVLNPV
jgi:hypothetical protein